MARDKREIGMAAKYKLHGRPGSGSFAVQVALEEIGAPYERIWVGRDEAALAAYRAAIPTGRVPALELPDGAVIFESAAMLIHLAHTHAPSALAPPPGTSAHAAFLQWMVFLSANVYESALRVYYPARYSARGEADAEAIREQAATDFFAHLDLVSRRLAPFILGGDYSIADAYLYMLASWYPDKPELGLRLPALQAHAQRLAGRPAIAKAEADHAA
jgi:glutathione S-transferase